MGTRKQSYSYGDNTVSVASGGLRARGRGNVVNYAPVVSTTKIDNSTTNVNPTFSTTRIEPAEPDYSAATPAAPTSAAPSGRMESLTSGGNVPRWAWYAAGAILLWIVWRKFSKKAA